MGVLYYQKPGKLRWEFEGTQPETIVSDGTTIYDYDPGLNQVVETPLDQAFKGQPVAAFLLGAGNLKRDFTVTPLSGPSSDRLQRLELTPKAGGQRLEVGIDPKTYNIGSLTVLDPMGNKTELRFSNVQLNQPQNAAQFQFTPPDGADIVNSQQSR
jgi:outer membrane lipoprotein carrier protein